MNTDDGKWEPDPNGLSELDIFTLFPEYRPIQRARSGPQARPVPAVTQPSVPSNSHSRGDKQPEHPFAPTPEEEWQDGLDAIEDFDWSGTGMEQTDNVTAQSAEHDTDPALDITEEMAGGEDFVMDDVAGVTSSGDTQLNILGTDVQPAQSNDGPLGMAEDDLAWHEEFTERFREEAAILDDEDFMNVNIEAYIATKTVAEDEHTVGTQDAPSGLEGPMEALIVSPGSPARDADVEINAPTEVKAEEVVLAPSTQPSTKQDDTKVADLTETALKQAVGTAGSDEGSHKQIAISIKQLPNIMDTREHLVDKTRSSTPIPLDTGSRNTFNSTSTQIAPRNPVSFRELSSLSTTFSQSMYASQASSADPHWHQGKFTFMSRRPPTRGHLESGSDILEVGRDDHLFPSRDDHLATKADDDEYELATTVPAKRTTAPTPKKEPLPKRAKMSSVKRKVKAKKVEEEDYEADDDDIDYPPKTKTTTPRKPTRSTSTLATSVPASKDSPTRNKYGFSNSPRRPRAKAVAGDSDAQEIKGKGRKKQSKGRASKAKNEEDTEDSNGVPSRRNTRRASTQAEEARKEKEKEENIGLRLRSHD